MYTRYFGFQEEPFSLTPTSRLFYSNPVYEEAYTRLLDGIRQRLGFMMLTGEVGTGKTTLLRRLMNRLLEDANIKVFSSHYSTLTFEELLSFICNDLGVNGAQEGQAQDIRALTEFLTARANVGGTTVLLLDEAQDLEEELLENLFTLWRSQFSGKQLLQIVLVGQQPELEEKLQQPNLNQLKQCLAVQCRLKHLKPDEVNTFIHHRLGLVGCKRLDLFTQDALKLIALYSQGIPRLVNLLCDNALGIACENSQDRVSAEMIRAVVRNLRLEESEVTRAENDQRQKPVEGSDDVLLGARKEAAPETLGQDGLDAHDNLEAMSYAATTKQIKRMPRVLVWSGTVGGALIMAGAALFFSSGQPWHAQTLDPPASVQATTTEASNSLSPSVNEAAVAPANQSTPSFAALPLPDPTSPHAQRGRVVLQRLVEKYPDLRPMVWGLGTTTPALALLLPQTAWETLAKEDQRDLTWYLEELIPTVRTQPDQYLEEFRSASLYEIFRNKLAGLCKDCWLIAWDRQASNDQDLLFDKVVVQGNSLWEKSDRDNRGMKASEFRGGIPDAR